MTLTLSPLNALAFVATMKTMNDLGKLAIVEDGTVSAFLATSNEPDAIAADATLVVDAMYTGAKGEWAVRFPAGVLTVALLDEKFAETQPFCILESDAGIRAVVPLTYERTYTATVSST